MVTTTAWTLMTVFAGLAGTAQAQVRAMPGTIRAQYTGPDFPCGDKPIAQPDGNATRQSFDPDCGKAPVEPPVIEPVRPVCPDGACGEQPRRPDPCWYDDCPNGGGLLDRWRIDKEALRDDDLGARGQTLAALFDNMAAKADHGTAVDARMAGAGSTSPAALSAAGLRTAALHRQGIIVPSPEFVGRADRSKGTSAPYGLGTILLFTIGGLAATRRSRIVLASDDRNNPQNDDDVRNGYNKHHENYCEKHPSSKACQPTEPPPGKDENLYDGKTAEGAISKSTETAPVVRSY